MDPYIELEFRFGAWVGQSNMVACSSGSAALHLALESFQLPAGSEVLVPEYTMVACARAVTQAGLVPVFVDCDDSLLMDPMQCSRQITPITRAIMPVHIYGRSCDMESFSTLADVAGQQYGKPIYVVEDCAEYHGGTLSGLADASCWSFYRNKIVAGEEGGMVSFREPGFANWARMLRCQGFTPDHDYYHVPRGVNARLSNANAQLILDSLDNVDFNLARRKQVERWYNQYIPTEWHMPPRDVCWVYDVNVPCMDMHKTIATLNRFGVAARHGFKPMSRQVEYINGLPGHNASRLAKSVFYLPVDPQMTEGDVQHAARVLQAAVEQ